MACATLKPRPKKFWRSSSIRNIVFRAKGTVLLFSAHVQSYLFWQFFFLKHSNNTSFGTFVFMLELQKCQEWIPGSICFDIGIYNIKIGLPWQNYRKCGKVSISTLLLIAVLKQWVVWDLWSHITVLKIAGVKSHENLLLFTALKHEDCPKTTDSVMF